MSQQCSVLCRCYRFKGWYKSNPVSHKMSLWGLRSTSMCWPRVTGVPGRITRTSHCSGHSTSGGLQPSAGANKTGCPQLCKALLPASVLQTKGPYSLLMDWMQKLCKTFCLLGQKRNGPTNLHLPVQNAWKEEREGRRKYLRQSKYLNCDFCYL